MNNNNLASIYIIRAVSNLHAGSGDTNYGVIDNLVQRESINNYPTINSSSLKGALREHFTHQFKLAAQNATTDLARLIAETQSQEAITVIFGNDSKENDPKKKKFQPGAYHFHAAHLLSIPVRCSKGVPFVRVTTPEIIEELENYQFLFQAGLGKGFDDAIQDFKAIAGNVVPGKPMVFDESLRSAYLEEQDFQADFTDTLKPSTHDAIENLLGRNYCVMHNDDFQEIVDNLPVIARNQLDNGESKNLWYEEIVPREARFYTAIQRVKECTKVFNELVNADRLIQIGANASVGYGKCQFNELKIKN